jgi:hypothetical protein
MIYQVQPDGCVRAFDRLRDFEAKRDEQGTIYAVLPSNPKLYSKVEPNLALKNQVWGFKTRGTPAFIRVDA